MEEESNIYGTVVKKTVMGEDVEYCKEAGCRHSSDAAHSRKPGRCSPALLLSVAFISLGGSIPIGYICGSSTNPYHVEDLWVRVPMLTLRRVLLGGGVLGAGVAATLVDRVGRRRTAVLGQAAGAVGAVAHLIATFTQSQAVLVFAWIPLGLFAGVGMSVLPLYLVELVPVALRGSAGTVYTVGTSLGLLLSQTLSLHGALATGRGHPYLVPIFLVPVLISWFLLSHVPESPIFLYFVKKDTANATVEWARLSGTDEDLAEEDLRSRSHSQKEDKGSSGATSRQRWVLMTTLLCAAHFSQALGESDQLNHLSGARPLLAETDVVAVGYTTSVINCILALVLVQLISVVSWRLLLSTSCLTSALLLFVMAVFSLQENTDDRTVYLMLITLLIQVVLFDLGLRPIPYFLASELFDAVMSPSMMALGAAISFLGQLVSDLWFLFVGVGLFRVSAALFLLIFVALLQVFISFTDDSRDESSKKAASPKVHPRVCHLPNPH